MGSRISPTVIGAFVVGALVCIVAGVLLFGGGKFFREKLPGYCWRIYFKVLAVLFSCVSFPSFFAFQEGMWDTHISALLSSPTVSTR
jgi:hypothetical protein